MYTIIMRIMPYIHRTINSPVRTAAQRVRVLINSRWVRFTEAGKINVADCAPPRSTSHMGYTGRVNGECLTKHTHRDIKQQHANKKTAQTISKCTLNKFQSDRFVSHAARHLNARARAPSRANRPKTTFKLTNKLGHVLVYIDTYVQPRQVSTITCHHRQR